VRAADELLELPDDPMIGKAHPGIRQIGDRLPVKRAAFAEDIERHAGQGEPARLLEEGLKLCPGGLTRADELMNDHGLPLSQRVVSIRTPENIELSYALAGPGSRAAAYIIDLLIMFGVCQILINLLVYAVAMLFSTLSGEGKSWASAIATLVFFSLYNGYFILLEWLMNGQTPGKRLLHIRVIKQGGYALRFFDTLLRNLLRVVDFLPLFYGVGLTSLLFTRESQRLGDLVAGTLVVYQEPVETGSLLPDLAASVESELPLPPAQLAAIPDEAIALADEYLRSRTELAPRPRQEIAAELVNLIRETSGLEPQPAQGVERFLVSVVRQSEPGPPLSYPPPEPAVLPS
jgi:uncharacterized RDD family membrane protein YckC